MVYCLLRKLKCLPWSVAIFPAMADSVNNNIVQLFSYNSRGFNDSKRCYLSSVLTECDILLLQEHWLSDAQLSCLSTLSSDHVAVWVSGFGNSDVLSGRPYGAAQ